MSSNLFARYKELRKLGHRARSAANLARWAANSPPCRVSSIEPSAAWKSGRPAIRVAPNGGLPPKCGGERPALWVAAILETHELAALLAAPGDKAAEALADQTFRGIRWTAAEALERPGATLPARQAVLWLAFTLDDDGLFSAEEDYGGGIVRAERIVGGDNYKGPRPSYMNRTNSSLFGGRSCDFHGHRELPALWALNSEFPALVRGARRKLRAAPKGGDGRSRQVAFEEDAERLKKVREEFQAEDEGERSVFLPWIVVSLPGVGLRSGPLPCHLVASSRSSRWEAIVREFVGDLSGYEAQSELEELLRDAAAEARAALRILSPCDLVPAARAEPSPAEPEAPAA